MIWKPRCHRNQHAVTSATSSATHEPKSTATYVAYLHFTLELPIHPLHFLFSPPSSFRLHHDTHNHPAPDDEILQTSLRELDAIHDTLDSTPCLDQYANLREQAVYLESSIQSILQRQESPDLQSPSASQSGPPAGYGNSTPPK